MVYGLPIGFGNDYGSEDKNIISTQHAGNDYAKIISLGKTSCKKLESQNTHYNRSLNPKDWIHYSQFWRPINF